MKAISKAKVICINEIIIPKTFLQSSHIYKVVPHALPHLILPASSEEGIISDAHYLLLYFTELYKAMTLNDLSRVTQLVRDEVRTLPQVF